MVYLAMSKARMVLKNASLVFAATLFCNSFASTTAIANPLNTLHFRTLNQSIYCIYQEDEQDLDLSSLRCQTQFVLKPLPPKPADCDLDWGVGLRLANSGQVSVVCAGDTIVGDYAILDYGRVWEKGGLRCVARRSGLTCKSRNGKGFFLSREGWRKI